MEITTEKPYVIGLDMGGTNSIFGIVDQRGTIKAQTAIKTAAYPRIEDYVTEDELVSYMSEMGMCKKNDLVRKFRDTGKLKSQRQKEVFLELVQKKLVCKEVDGQKWLVLKRVKKH